MRACMCEIMLTLYFAHIQHTHIHTQSAINAARMCVIRLGSCRHELRQMRRTQRHQAGPDAGLGHVRVWVAQLIRTMGTYRERTTTTTKRHACPTSVPCQRVRPAGSLAQHVVVTHTYLAKQFSRAPAPVVSLWSRGWRAGVRVALGLLSVASVHDAAAVSVEWVCGRRRRSLNSEGNARACTPSACVCVWCVWLTSACVSSESVSAIE